MQNESGQNIKNNKISPKNNNNTENPENNNNSPSKPSLCSSLARLCSKLCFTRNTAVIDFNNSANNKKGSPGIDYESPDPEKNGVDSGEPTALAVNPIGAAAGTTESSVVSSATEKLEENGSFCMFDLFKKKYSVKKSSFFSWRLNSVLDKCTWDN